jgi:uncharacterized protein (DUF427 family)
LPRATWNGVVLAEASSDELELVEGNVYFPPGAVRSEHLQPSDTHTICPWKGTASYYDVAVDGEVNRDAAWYYPDPKPAAQNIAGHIAFWRGVRVEPTP